MFRLDGGAMFGVVPKVLWEQKNPADERNRILLGLRCLLVDDGETRILVDDGIGGKFDQKWREIYGIRRERTLLDELAALGLVPEDIDYVVNTHLHFDHAGGNTRLEGGALAPTFPNAQYLIQAREWEDGAHPNERTRASYLQENIAPLKEAGVVELVDGETEIIPGVRLIPTPGHTQGHQSPLIEGGGQRVFYPGDLIPTSSHLALPWIMGYDSFPLITLETKRSLLARAYEEDWLLVFEHDPKIPAGRVVRESGRYEVAPVPLGGGGGAEECG